MKKIWFFLFLVVLACLYWLGDHSPNRLHVQDDGLVVKACVPSPQGYFCREKGEDGFDRMVRDIL